MGPVPPFPQLTQCSSSYNSPTNFTADETAVTTRSSTLDDARNLLVCLRYGIGDVVMQFPMLDALRRAVRHARITAVGAHPAIELLENSGLVDEILT
jgi:hypothetical protein